jgi:hypothetical protein
MVGIFSFLHISPNFIVYYFNLSILIPFASLEVIKLMWICTISWLYFVINNVC